MSKLNYYRVALYLCAAIALTEAIWILAFVMPRMPTYANGFIITLIVAVITILGLLLRSNLIRYFGAVVLVVWGAVLVGGFVWGLVSGGTAPLPRLTYPVIIVFSYYAFSAALNLLTAAILLFSKQFAYEFAKLRESAPKYIIYLRRLLIGATIACNGLCDFQ
jgi:hypothetical protein